MTPALIYGGESHFDNMRSFFLGNGFTTIVEQKDFRTRCSRILGRLG